LDEAALLAHQHPECRQSVEIERIEFAGDTARVTTRRVESVKVFRWFPWASVSRWAETWLRVNGSWVCLKERLDPEIPKRWS
jgi:hypothetical protein